MAESIRPVRTGIYGRVSTANHGQDVELQMSELRQAATQRGWHVVGEFIDEGFSGGLASRPSLDAMLEQARRGKLDLIAVWRIDRLGRSLQHLLAVLDELQHLGVGFVSLRDCGIDTTSPSGKLLFHVLASFAEYEKSIIRERVLAGVRRAQAAGKACGRPRVELDLRPALALLDQGRGLKQVAAILKINKNTLRARLTEEGRWPRQPGSTTLQSPTPQNECSGGVDRSGQKMPQEIDVS